MIRHIVAFLILSQVLCNFDQQWYPMPDGKLYHIDCIHHFDEHVHLEASGNSDTVTTSQGTRSYDICPHQPITSPNAKYYSQWVAYVEATHEPGYSSMYSEFAVPSYPKSRGPAGLSSVYIFNGLEDGGGHTGKASLILQPVLQIGKSGCLLNPLNYNQYWLTSYMVTGAGRAYCGKKLGPLKEGERLGAKMSLVDKASGKWLVESTRFKTGHVSSTSTLLPNVTLDAAYLTLEGMVIYGCDAFPQSNNIEFSNNVLLDTEGRVVKPKWNKIINHGECNQDVEIGETVRIKWEHDKLNIPQ